MQALSLSFEIAVPVFLGAFVGYQIDRWLKSQPWGLVVGVVLGGLAGLWNAYKFYIKVNNEHP